MLRFGIGRSTVCNRSERKENRPNNKLITEDENEIPNRCYKLYELGYQNLQNDQVEEQKNDQREEQQGPI